MANAPRDENRIPTLLGVSSIDGVTPIPPTVTNNKLDTNVFANLALPQFDYLAMVIAPAGTETYTFKTGGSGGTTVATVVIVYTDATRADISTVTKT